MSKLLKFCNSEEVDADSLSKDNVNSYVKVLEEDCGEGPSGIVQKLTALLYFKVRMYEMLTVLFMNFNLSVRNVFEQHKS